MLTLFHGDKGGVGKSFCCCSYIDALISQGRSDEVLVVESDTRNPDVARMFQSYLPVRKVDLKKHEGWMQLIDIMAQDPNREVVVSLPAGVGHQLEKESDYLVYVLSQLEHPLRVFWPINRMKDSLILLRSFLNTSVAASALRIEVIMNGVFGEKEQFTRWLESKTRQEFLQLKQAGEFYLPELHCRVVDDVSGPFSQSIKDLPFSSRVELERWMADGYERFFSAGKA